MLLPQLDDGITLLDVEGGRGVPILQSLVLDHLLLRRARLLGRRKRARNDGNTRADLP